jgi:hypothetical protein
MDTIVRDTRPAKPAARPRAAKKALRAKPVKGEVDQMVLTEKVIARFPNILKALAE